MIWQIDINNLLEIENNEKLKTNNKLISSADVSIELLNFYMRKRLIRDYRNKRWYIMKRGLKKLRTKEIDDTEYDMFYDCSSKRLFEKLDNIRRDNNNYFFFRIKGEQNIFFIDNYNAQYLYNRRKSNKLFYIVYTIWDDSKNGGSIVNKVLYISDYKKYIEKGYFR